MQDKLLIPVIYARLVSHKAAKTPAQVRSVLEGTGVDELRHGYQSSGMTLEQYRRLIRNAITVSGDEMIMLKAGLELPITTHGALGPAVATSPTLNDTLEVFTYFVRVRNPYCYCTRVLRGRYTELVFEKDEAYGDDYQPAMDLTLAAVVAGILRYVGANLSHFSVKLKRQAPKDADIYSRLLGCPVSYAEEVNSLLFLTDELDQPLKGANINEHQRALARCRAIYSSIITNTSVKDAVVNTFIKQTGRICTLATVAEVLHISTRTLNRRLKAENTSFQAVLDEWLSQEALNYLLQDGLSVEVTAMLLGYRDEANFRRAFKRWFGAAPSIYLQQFSEYR